MNIIGIFLSFSRSRAISAADANVLIDQAKQDMIGVKNKMEADRAKQEAELHKKLSNLKKKRLSDQNKEHEAEIREFDKKCGEMQKDGPVGKAGTALLSYQIE